MFWLPGEEGRRVAGLAQLIDVMPTLLELAGIRPARRGQGRSLLPLLRGAAPGNEYTFAGCPHNQSNIPYYFDDASVMESIRGVSWKMIHEETIAHSLAWKFRRGLFTRVPRDRWRLLFEALLHPFELRTSSFELYEVSQDPAEARNLAAARPEVLREMQAKLDAWRADATRFTPLRPETRSVPASLLEDARRRGYW